MPIIDRMKEKVKNVRNQGYNFVTGHKGETIGISLAVIAVASLTAAYLLSPAYATFVGTVGTKAATLVSPAITAMSAFAVAHPLIASLVVLAAVAALITAPVYAYKNSNKAAQIEDLNKANNDKASQIGKAGELLNGEAPETKLNEIIQILGVQKGTAKS
ncbi:hypothetical protein [Wolbachia endosymbiont (group B) of Athalia cordata]|uniref:hypothetical protein n=1 Tax=Wolbachia endosymbiont (group B) of Athalia cordata TaxID=2953986 RepID=UPI0022307601|nr:hypothetical protein [Wolbachia endosymbiont (group B) of Athalia cordata]